MSDRASLAARQLPAMTLSDGLAPASKTAPPLPLSASLTPAERAQERFGISGNAISTFIYVQSIAFAHGQSILFIDYLLTDMIALSYGRCWNASIERSEGSS